MKIISLKFKEINSLFSKGKADEILLSKGHENQQLAQVDVRPVAWFLVQWMSRGHTSGVRQDNVGLTWCTLSAGFHFVLFHFRASEG